MSQDGVLLFCTGPATSSRLAGLTHGILLCRSPAKAVNGTAGRRSSTGGAAPPKRPAATSSKPAAKRRGSVPSTPNKCTPTSDCIVMHFSGCAWMRQPNNSHHACKSSADRLLGNMLTVYLATTLNNPFLTKHDVSQSSRQFGPSAIATTPLHVAAVADSDEESDEDDDFAAPARKVQKQGSGSSSKARAAAKPPSRTTSNAQAPGARPSSGGGRPGSAGRSGKSAAERPAAKPRPLVASTQKVG